MAAAAAVNKIYVVYANLFAYVFKGKGIGG